MEFPVLVLLRLLFISADLFGSSFGDNFKVGVQFGIVPACAIGR